MDPMIPCGFGKIGYQDNERAEAMKGIKEKLAEEVQRLEQERVDLLEKFLDN